MNINPLEQEKIIQAANLLKGCGSILFITGAGISAESGLPTYRGIGGLYNQNTTEDGIPVETVLAGETLRSKPELTWKYIYQIESKCRDAKFNRAHEVISEMEKNFERVWVLTQNIDGFHQQAGSKNVIDIHGDIHDLYCPYCSWSLRVKDYGELEIPPRCPDCNGIVRPKVVFFGETLPEDKVQLLFTQLEQGFDIYFSIGTTSVFPYIKQPAYEARARNKPVIEINPDKTEISHLVQVKVSLGAAWALDNLWREYKKLS